MASYGVGLDPLFSPTIPELYADKKTGENVMAGKDLGERVDYMRQNPGYNPPEGIDKITPMGPDLKSARFDYMLQHLTTAAKLGTEPDKELLRRYANAEDLIPKAPEPEKLYVPQRRSMTSGGMEDVGPATANPHFELRRSATSGAMEMFAPGSKEDKLNPRFGTDTIFREVQPGEKGVAGIVGAARGTAPKATQSGFNPSEFHPIDLMDTGVPNPIAQGQPGVGGPSYGTGKRKQREDLRAR